MMLSRGHRELNPMALPEPRTRALVACQIQTGAAMTWTDRTYEVVRAEDGQWRVDFGEGTLEPRRSWQDVLAWLASLRPRHLEMLGYP